MAVSSAYEIIEFCGLFASKSVTYKIKNENGPKIVP